MVHLPVPSANVVAAAPPTQITPSPATEHVELRLRQTVAPTCAYLSGDTASPLTCGSSFSCSRGTFQEFGCCNAFECDKNYAVACIDPSNQECRVAGYTFNCNQNYFGTVLTCPNACVTYMLKVPGAFSTGTYKSYSCASSGGTRIALATATNGAGGGDSGDGNGGGGQGGGGGFPTPIIPGLETTTAGSGSGGGGSNDNNNNGGNSGLTNGNNNSASSNEGGGLSPGAIAGIVIGGVVGALLVGLGIWWMCHRKSKKAPPPNYSQTVVSGWLDQTH